MAADTQRLVAEALLKAEKKLKAIKTWLWKNRYTEEKAVTEIYKLLGYDLNVRYDRGEKEFRLDKILEAEG